MLCGHRQLQTHTFDANRSVSATDGNPFNFWSPSHNIMIEFSVVQNQVTHLHAMAILYQFVVILQYYEMWWKRKATYAWPTAAAVVNVSRIKDNEMKMMQTKTENWTIVCRWIGALPDNRFTICMPIGSVGLLLLVLTMSPHINHISLGQSV